MAHFPLVQRFYFVGLFIVKNCSQIKYSIIRINKETGQCHQLHRECCTLRINLERAEKQKQAVRNRRMRVNFKEPYRHLSKIEIVPLRREGCEHEHVGCG